MVIAPRPLRDTSRAPRCALRMSAPAVVVGRVVTSTLSRGIAGSQLLSRGGTRSDSLRQGHRSSLGCMADKDAARAALRAFLVSRRGRVSPQEAGLAVVAARRRVAGLRREEGAMLGGISGGESACRPGISLNYTAGLGLARPPGPPPAWWTASPRFSAWTTTSARTWT